jgi:uncharacterized damage-inducible protein DinB
MAIKEALLAELKHESSSTRRILERVPGDKFAWKPHEKSYTLGRLATHIAQIPGWIMRIINHEQFDFAVNQYKPITAESNEQLMKIFEDTLAENIATLETASDDLLNNSWTFRRGEQIFFTLPRKVALRNMAFNHLVHHRGQLSVYLRLLNIPVPGMYGPSADETL